MSAILRLAPPPNYVKYARTAAWLRLGKIAVFSVLAGLAVAVGLAFPGDGKDAEAQEVVHRAYTYTQRFCQELGRYARYYNVRDPIPGSDWRSDGGWAIVQERGVTTVDAREITFNDNFVITQFRFRNSMGGLTLGALYTDNSGGTWDGWSGRMQLNAGNAESGFVWIDANGDGAITDADKIYGNGNQWRNLQLPVPVPGNPALVVSSRYIRWANMLWCR